jgi:hypothetical protein
VVIVNLLGCNAMQFEESANFPPVSAGFFLVSYFYAKGGDMFLRNVRLSPKYTA